jgi:hypothetical protein
MSVSGTSAIPLGVFESGIQTTTFSRSTCSFFIGIINYTWSHAIENVGGYSTTSSSQEGTDLRRRSIITIFG